MERPAFKKLIESGAIEVIDQDRRRLDAEKGSTAIPRGPLGHPSTRDTSRKGDR